MTEWADLTDGWSRGMSGLERGAEFRGEFFLGLLVDGDAAVAAGRGLKVAAGEMDPALGGFLIGRKMGQKDGFEVRGTVGVGGGDGPDAKGKMRLRPGIRLRRGVRQ